MVVSHKSQCVLPVMSEVGAIVSQVGANVSQNVLTVSQSVVTVSHIAVNVCQNIGTIHFSFATMN
jgi:hypothetical protein